MIIRRIVIICYVTLFFLAILSSFLLTGELALGIELVLLLIATLIFVREIWNYSKKQELIEHGQEAGKRQRSGEFPSVVLSLKGALEGYAGSREDLAIILREALLNKYAESKNYPRSWIYTDDAREAIKGMLGSNIDLIDIFEPDDKENNRHRSFFDRRVDVAYKTKLERALTLVEMTGETSN